MSRVLASIAQARQLVLDAVSGLPSEPVPLGNALDRTLAADVVAAANVPPFGNSAMDGFAVQSGASRRTLTIVGEARAGSPAGVAVGPGEAVRISTGAAMPDGADAVVPVEEIEERDGSVTVAVDSRAGDHVRAAGEDLRAGATVLPAGTRLGAAELALAIGAGASELTCARRPRVAIIGTGDELREPGAPLGPGEIHNSNGTMLAALALQAGAEVVAVEHVNDDREATAAGFAAALEKADVVIASGGVSVGPHDHVKPALTSLGVDEVFWRVSLQPGKPTWFGTRGEQVVFGLPGNPVSSYVTFLLFTRPALRKLVGGEPLPMRESAALAVEVRRGGREQAMRVRLASAPGDPTVRATPNGPQGSHITSSLHAADALAFVPAGDGALAAGEVVEIERI